MGHQPFGAHGNIFKMKKLPWTPFHPPHSTYYIGNKRMFLSRLISAGGGDPVGIREVSEFTYGSRGAMLVTPDVDS